MILPQVKKAFWRFAIATAALTTASALYYYIDETSIAYWELDGFIPALLLLRLALAILVVGMMFAIVYPLRVFLFKGWQDFREQRRQLADKSGIPPAGATPGGATRVTAGGVDPALPGIRQPQDNDFTRLMEGLFSRLLYLIAILISWFLLKPALDRALLPFGGAGWISIVFIFVFAGFAGYLALWFLMGLWLLISRMRDRNAAGQPVFHQAARPIAGGVFCIHCGTPNAAGNQFCGSCGQRME
ncbi:MAG: zinc ribbon domain-containing protein [Thermoleophilia bacterium]|jgi:hypothetical protein